ncbi:MAG: glycosyltransferase family 2 protein [Chlamydiae bacterium]|nr:glycosyltransferase family 2 protein [Chlamydiota bacterium]
MDLSIITVTYQSKEFIDTCILSVWTHLFTCEYEHIIVDNASNDGTVELIEEGYLNYVRLIKNTKNVGFAAANNQALKEARGNFVLFLNPDMQVCKGSIDEFINWAATIPDLGIASCKLVNHKQQAHDALRPSKFPQLRYFFPSFLNIIPFFCTVHPSSFSSSFRDEIIQEVELVRGAFMLIPRQVIDKIGYGFDPKYFILYEDVDLCKTMASLGLRVLYNPSLMCIDFFSRSFLEQSNAWKYLQLCKSLKTYIKKWHSRWHLFWITPISWLGFIIRIPRWGFRVSWLSLFK